MNSYFADLHIHLGRDRYNNPVKITGSKNLTLQNILQEARRKGLDLIGIIDAHVPTVIEELKELINHEVVIEREDGGISFEDTTLFLGSEIEIYDENCLGPIHVLCYFPTLEAMEEFSMWLSQRMKNINLSSQRYYGNAVTLQRKVKELAGLFIPAHIFTPFKSLYGKGVKSSLDEVFDAELIDGIELGLSSDTYMIEEITEIQRYPFLTNSDAHSLSKMAREYQAIQMESPSFQEFTLALKKKNGRKIIANYGMSPKLGKYYSTVCKKCLKEIKTTPCHHCGSLQLVKGVSERIQELSSEKTNTEHPPYIHQVPLEYLPKLGPKTYDKLINKFGTEMEIIHFANFSELTKVIPKNLAELIIANRQGKLSIKAGGGGKYGSIMIDS